MMKPLILLLGAAAIASLLAGCGFMRSLFPDKEKEYQYTTEIPPLVLPPDLAKPGNPFAALANNPVQAEAVPSPSQTVPPPATPAPVSPETANAQVFQPAPTVPAMAESGSSAIVPTAGAGPVKREPIKTSLQTDSGITVLRLATGFETAWRAVDKALSRKAIEVTERDKNAKQFNINYDPDEKALEDHGWWHEAMFMFGGVENHEQAFIVRLTEQPPHTEVQVLDPGQKPSTDESAMKLIKLLQATIEADFAK